MVDSPISSSRGPRRQSAFVRKSTVAIAGSALAFGGSIAMLAPTAGNASSHREAPLIANDPQADNTDVYAFVSPDKPDTVTLIANWIPFEEPAGGPNFFPWATDAHYDINLDTNGDATADVTYRWQFKTQDTRGTNTFLYANGPVTSLADPNLLFRQTYTLSEIKGDNAPVVLATNVAVAPSDIGNATIPKYANLRAQATKTLRGGLRTYAGQADDPFFLDLRVFDLLYGADLSEAGADSLGGFNVNTIALQLPKKALGFQNGESVLGVWSTTERPSMKVSGNGTEKYSGGYVQVSRLGNPLVNEVVVPAGLKDAFNSIPPSVDRTIPAVVAKVTDPELPKLIQGVYGIPAPKTPRNDLVSIYLTGLKGLNQPKTVTPAEMLRLNTAIAPSAKPSRLGVLGGDVAGFPNGRRLADDIVDISIQAVEGAVKVNAAGAPTGVALIKPLAAGDAVNVNDKAFSSTFPYIALPWSGSRVRPSSAPAPAKPAAAPAAPMTPQGPMNTGVRLVNDMSPAIPAGAAGLGALFAMAGVVLFRRERRFTVAAR